MKLIENKVSALPLTCVTDGTKPTIHRFFDTSPISPSGRYIALTEFDYDDRIPNPGDSANVVVIEIATGEYLYRTSTFAWDTQLGAQVQWGSTDSQLYFNRMHLTDFRPFGVCVNFLTLEEQTLDASIYMVSPCGSFSVTPNLNVLSRIQKGYGVIVPDEFSYSPPGISLTEGVTYLCLKKNESRLLFCIDDICKAIFTDSVLAKYDAGFFYIFHTKISPCSKKLMLILRWTKDLGARSDNFLVIYDFDSKKFTLAIDNIRWRHGHHPNWCPNSKSIVMNLLFKSRPYFFSDLVLIFQKVLNKFGIRYINGLSNIRIGLYHLQTEKIENYSGRTLGSGHPIMLSKAEIVITDCYPNELVAYKDQTVPIRLIKRGGAQIVLARLNTKPVFYGPEKIWRIDPHPVVSSDERFLVVNASVDGIRQVLLIDIRKIYDLV